MTNQGARVAIYARVSTHEQQVATQLLPLRDYINSRGWRLVEEFVDEGISGAKEQRPALTRLLDAVKRRRCDVVLVHRFDRFARSSRHLLNSLEEFRALGVDFVSLSEAIDTTTPAGKMVFSMVAAIAEFERSLIRERVMAGLHRARAQGKTLGRPKTKPKEDPVALRASGLSVPAIATRLGVSKSWVFARLSIKPPQISGPGSVERPG